MRYKTKGTADGWIYGGQARVDHGRRQRALDRLGYRQGLPRQWRPGGLHLPGRGPGEKGPASGQLDRQRHHLAVRCHQRRQHRCDLSRIFSTKGDIKSQFP